jgi:hypothetical protein
MARCEASESVKHRANIMPRQTKATVEHGAWAKLSKALVRVPIFASLAVLCSPAWAWHYSEHREISRRAVQGLDPERAREFNVFWQQARLGNETRLCAAAADSELILEPQCIDWAALPAIAGDRSCSSSEMMQTVLDSDWILGIAAISAELEAKLAEIRNAEAAGGGATRSEMAAMRAARANAGRTADVATQKVDPDLIARASTNFAHFALPRASTSLDPYAYGQSALRAGAPLNAIGAYSWYHFTAVQKANRLATEQLAPEERRQLARALLFDEAFALHFLEDVHAAGHLAGTWGDAAQRKGTHDYYNENGLEAFTWEGRDQTLVLMGDGYLNTQRATEIAEVVRASIEQVLDAAAGRTRGYELPPTPTASADPDEFDVCRTETLPQREGPLAFDERYKAPAEEVLLRTPVPSLGPGPGSLPRFRSEIGAFFGLASSIETRQLERGFVTSQTDSGHAGGVDVSFQAGIGLEGALGDAGDGLIFGSIGYHGDTNSSNEFSGRTLGGTLAAAIPARSGTTVRIRMPFYIVPGDLVFMSPLYLFKGKRPVYTKMAVTAANGGLIPWQTGIATRAGRLQFMLGREIGVTYYGRRRDDQLVVPDTSGGIGRIVNYESIRYDLPIFEYRPYRAFSANQTSAVLIQLFVGVDVPRNVSVSFPDGAPVPHLERIKFAGIRLVYDWRHYRSRQ